MDKKREAGLEKGYQKRLSTSGSIIAITGNGKGKTTSSVAMALKTVMMGEKVFFAQFLKGGLFTGECVFFRNLIKDSSMIKFHQFGKSSIYSEDIKHGRLLPGYDLFIQTKADKAHQKEGFQKCLEALQSEKYSLVILDEINVAVSMHIISLKDVKKAIRLKPDSCTLVLTGRQLHPKILEMCDIACEAYPVKHPYDQNFFGRRGIEF